MLSFQKYTIKVVSETRTKSSNKKAKIWYIAETRKDLGDEICDNILFLHAILGCDTTSKPSGIGKGASHSAFQKDADFRNSAHVFNKDPGVVSKEEIIAAGEAAIMILEWKDMSNVVAVEEYGWQLRNDILEPVKTDKAPAPQNILK